ncbi:hypothetical protein G7070_13140 [Propioniciclava coleopterorum]|uniref:Uncharacterized protein n=1 Tax=Propioniciclava coleopterorum TaxID=2714937 RepID=A0A6G7Y8S4_9ACTN|nr:hypothetical protein [Propioniciclava coleopterorum]QIK73031.1 hypothetical protein G7070_13140 [Propioniciclava coleopterorum]
MTGTHEPGPLGDLLGNLTGHAAGHYGARDHEDGEHVSETQGPIDHTHSPLKRRPEDADEESQRPTTLADDGDDGGL